MRTIVKRLVLVAGAVLLALVVAYSTWMTYQLYGEHKQQQMRSTMIALRDIGQAAEKFIGAGGAFPPLADVPVSEALPLLATHSQRTLPTHDAWGSEFLFVALDRQYAVWSRGSDGAADLDFETGVFDDDARDIVYTDGGFITWPRGISGDGKPSNTLAELREAIRRHGITNQ